MANCKNRNNSKAYSVYLLFRFVFSLAVSMSTVLSIVYHLEVVQLDAFQLVLVLSLIHICCASGSSCFRNRLYKSSSIGIFSGTGSARYS